MCVCVCVCGSATLVSVCLRACVSVCARVRGAGAAPTVKMAEQVETGQQDKPLKVVKIAECGELTGEAKLTAETADYLATYSKAPAGK